MRGYYTNRWEYKGIEIIDAEPDPDFPSLVCWIEKCGPLKYTERAQVGVNFFDNLDDAIKNVKKKRRNLIAKIKRNLERVQNIDIKDLLPVE